MLHTTCLMLKSYHWLYSFPKVPHSANAKSLLCCAALKSTSRGEWVSSLSWKLQCFSDLNLLSERKKCLINSLPDPGLRHKEHPLTMMTTPVLVDDIRQQRNSVNRVKKKEKHLLAEFNSFVFFLHFSIIFSSLLVSLPQLNSTTLDPRSREERKENTNPTLTTREHAIKWKGSRNDERPKWKIRNLEFEIKKKHFIIVVSRLLRSSTTRWRVRWALKQDVIVDDMSKLLHSALRRMGMGREKNRKESTNFLYVK